MMLQYGKVDTHGFVLDFGVRRYLSCVYVHMFSLACVYFLGLCIYDVFSLLDSIHASVCGSER